MSHDKIRAAARKRMAETGEPYAAARRAVVSEHQAAGGQIPPPGAGYALRMSGEIHDWLADLRDSDPPTAARVRRALAALMKEGAGLGDPLVVSTAESWPWALAEALDRSYSGAPGPAAGRALGRGRGHGPCPGTSRIRSAELESARAKLDDEAPPCAGCGQAAGGRAGSEPSWPRFSSRRPRCGGCCRG